MRGRPQLYVNRHALTIVISKDDYNALCARAEEIALDRPGFGLGDLVREFIQRGLGRHARELRPADERGVRVRQLHAISRTALELAKELKGA